MAVCSLCEKHAYDPDVDQVCFACRVEDENNEMIMGAEYLMKGHTPECALGLFNCKPCICEVENGNTPKTSHEDSGTKKSFE